MDWDLVLGIFVAGGTAFAFLGSLVWWLSSQFNTVRKLCYEIKDQILAKLEYHEKHDDERFQSLSKDIWEIRIRNASIDGRNVIKQSAVSGVEH